jgi:hypothetical protein
MAGRVSLVHDGRLDLAVQPVEQIISGEKQNSGSMSSVMCSQQTLIQVYAQCQNSGIHMGCGHYGEACKAYKSLLTEKKVSFIEVKVVKIAEVARADLFQSLKPR